MSAGHAASLPRLCPSLRQADARQDGALMDHNLLDGDHIVVVPIGPYGDVYTTLSVYASCLAHLSTVEPMAPLLDKTVPGGIRNVFHGVSSTSLVLTTTQSNNCALFMPAVWQHPTRVGLSFIFLRVQEWERARPFSLSHRWRQAGAR